MSFFYIYRKEGLENNIFLITLIISYMSKKKNTSDSSEKKYLRLTILEPSRILKAICTWAQHLDEPEDAEFDSSPILYTFGLNTKMLGLTTLPTYICLSSTLS